LIRWNRLTGTISFADILIKEILLSNRARVRFIYSATAWVRA